MPFPNSLISMHNDLLNGKSFTSHCNKLVADLKEYGRDCIEISYDEYEDYEVFEEEISYDSEACVSDEFWQKASYEFQEMSNSEQLINMFKDMEYQLDVQYDGKFDDVF